jgi:hypothetical protein
MGGNHALGDSGYSSDSFGFLGSVFIEPEAQVLFRLWFRFLTMSAKGSRQAACLTGIEIQHSGTLSPIASSSHDVGWSRPDDRWQVKSRIVTASVLGGSQRNYRPGSWPANS